MMILERWEGADYALGLTLDLIIWREMERDGEIKNKH